MLPPVARRVTNAIARSLRQVRRTIAPDFDVGTSPLARAYLRWVHDAARLDYVDDVVGHRMYLDDRDSLRLSVARVFEPVTTDYVRGILRGGERVVDVGANIGYFTLLFARHVGPSGRVFAFEPDPANFALLRRNVEANAYENVTAENKALWDESGPMRLFLSEENRGDHRVYASGEERPSVSIEAIRLDEYQEIADHPVDLIKMDVQGAEEHALAGMASVIERSPRVTLITEFWPAALAAAGSSAPRYLAALADLGFDLRMIDDRDERIVAADPGALLEQYTVDNHASADLICTRRA